MQTLPIWPGKPPGALGTDSSDIPTLEIYEPFGRTFLRAAVLILPGGGYGMLSAQEGEGYAGVFQLMGFHAFVLNYRLGSDGYRHPIMWQDATRAMRIVRSRAEQDGFDPHKIVIVGSSAGGHLAATLLTRWDGGQAGADDPIERVSSRPDLGVLCYPVITMGVKAHSGSRQNLLGDHPSEALVQELSANTNVCADTPPCFVWHTWEDGIVPVDESLAFISALRKAGVPFECHIYQDGPHGLGMKDGLRWPEDCLAWLQRRLGVARS